jgi:hypothetical protein
MTDQHATIAKLRELELSLHRPDVRASRERVGQLLTDDFVEFGRSGTVYDKSLLLDLLARENGSAQPPPVSEFAVRFLAPDVALVTYRALAPKRETLRSSIWRREGSGWRMTFHQGTAVPPK